MKIHSPLLYNAAGFLGSLACRGLAGSLECTGAYYDARVDPAHPEFAGPAIFLIWHEYILLPFCFRAHCNVAVLLSRHQDAEVLSHAARQMGFQTIRGSTNRGGVAALRQSLRNSRHMSLAITPDGPRGPRRRLAPGCIYLSSKLGIPLVAIGIGFERPWRVLGAWDHFAIPRPYSRARAIVSPFLQIPPDLNRAGLEHYRNRVESLLNRLTLDAEQWAGSLRRKAGQQPLRPERARRQRRRSLSDGESPPGQRSRAA